MFRVDGMGWVMRECSEEVLLGTIKFWSFWSRVPGRASRSLVRGRTKEEWLLSDGLMVAESGSAGLVKDRTNEGCVSQGDAAICLILTEKVERLIRGMAVGR